MTTPPQPSRPVDAIADQYVEDAAALDPAMAAYAGIAGHDHELPDLSPDGFEARTDLARRAVAAMSATTPADEREAVARDAFLERVGLVVENADAGHDRAEVSVISSWAHAIRESFDLMSTETDEGREDVRARLAGIPDALEAYRTTLAEEADAAVFAGGRPTDAQVDRYWDAVAESVTEIRSGGTAWTRARGRLSRASLRARRPSRGGPDRRGRPRSSGRCRRPAGSPGSCRPVRRGRGRWRPCRRTRSG